MASSICASCLVRIRASSLATRLPLPSLPLTATQSFHSTPFQSNVVKKKSGTAHAKKFRESTSAKIKKKARRERPKPPAAGERRALRKRIVLSNTNALAIPDMEDLTPLNMSDEGRVGQVLG